MSHATEMSTANGLTISFILSIVFAKTSGFDYCTISKVHTMCVYKTISKNCVQYKTQNAIVVRRILNDHNMARSQFAGGHKGYFIPNMMKMYWDQELADLSARWACQCKGALDADRGVRRFEVGQVVWTIMHPHNFTMWNDIWKYIIGGGTGFYQRDNWGKMITNYDPADPPSLIFNPTVRFLGCTLANYLIWSVEASSFAYTTTLVCNYGPVEESYEKYPKEDWPCRDCPEGMPCSIKYYMRGTVMPPNLPNERNLCIDPKLEYQNPRPGKSCPVHLQDAAREPQADVDVSDARSITPQERERHQVKKITTLLEPPAVVPKDSTSKTPGSATANGSTTEHWITDYWKPNDWTTGNPDDYWVDYFPTVTTTIQPKTQHLTTQPQTTHQTTHHQTTQHPTTHHLETHTTNNWTTEAEHGSTDDGGHQPTEQEYDYHGPIDSEGHVNYCELRCVDHVKHTLCLFHETSPVCGHFTSLTNSITERDLLHLHNEYRNDYTEGAVGPPHPLASNMVRLHWSKKLESTADIWLRQCKLEHDGCRDEILTHPGTGRDKIFRVSQNIGWKEYNLNETCPSHYELFNDWKEQAKNFTSTSIADFLSYQPNAGARVDDFIQLIWARTHYVGCAYGSFASKNVGKGIAMLVCNYAPFGKEVGKNIYIPGGPCSLCFTDTALKHGRCYLTKYPNLCDAGVARRASITAFIIYSVISWILHSS